MTIGDLIGLRDFPGVVQAADVRELRENALSGRDAGAAEEFIGGYLGFDQSSRDALRWTLESLALRGGAFFLNGVFGSGKSHLLGVLALLGDRIGHRTFGTLHPHFAPQLHRFAPRLVVHFSLDDYAAAQWPLEAIFQREVQSEWARRGFSSDEIAFPVGLSRGEQFALIDEALRAHDLSGLIVCIDELSLFLSAKEHRELQADAAFLQFLGQRAARQSTLSGLWIFAALQKSVENIGSIESYSLSQIKDRFTTLPLSLAHVPSLIEKRLIEKRDADALQRVCRDTFETSSRAFPHLDFGREEWERLYPFHPATVALLEAVVARFFSRTRSAVLFCAHSIDLDADAATRVLPDALFDYLAPELEAHPDLRSLATVWRHWNESAEDIAGSDDADALRRVMKGLLLGKIAGIAPTAVQLANALHLDARLPGEGNYQWTHVLLERLRSHGSYLSVERGESDLADRYAIDIGTRVGELARRAVQSTLRELEVHDTRMGRYAIACCRDEALPLSSLQEARPFTLMWRNAPREVLCGLWHETLSIEHIANTLAALAQPGASQDALILIAAPFSATTDSIWNTAMDDVLSLISEPHQRAALIVWTPRAPAADEWQSAREATAQHLLESDPSLLDNRRGRAVLTHLQNESAARQSTLARLSLRLLREGTLRSGANLSIEGGDLAHGQSWTATLEAIAEWALPAVFPHWESIAPRLRVLTPGNADQLCLEILRRPSDAPFFAPSLERIVRGVAEPLGIAHQAQGRWTIGAPREELRAAVLELIGEPGAPLSHIEATLAKSAWGLKPEQSALVLCAMLRDGEIVAQDARGQNLSPTQIGLPLRRAVHGLRRGQQLDEATWHQLRGIGRVFGMEASKVLSFAAQQELYGRLLQWREETQSEAELAQARLHQLQRQLAQTPAQWPHAHNVQSGLNNLLSALNGSALEVLSRLSAFEVEAIENTLQNWRELVSGLDEQHALLLQSHAFLTHPQLSSPPQLAAARERLLLRFEDAEAILNDLDLLVQCATWRQEYGAIYQSWHNTQNAAERWAGLRRLAASDALRASERLALLGNRAFESAAIVRRDVADEFEKMCARDGTIGSEPVCPSCRLRWSERLLLRDVREREELLRADLDALRALLHEDAVSAILRRHQRAAALLDWAANEKADENELLPLLSDDVLQALDDALRPRRCVLRSRSQLVQELESCRTRDEFQSTFIQWLNGDENLAGDDEIVIED